MNPQRRTWRPLLTIAALALIALAVIWAWPEVQRQQRYLRTAGTFLSATVLAAFWFILRGPLPLRARMLVVLSALALLTIVASTFRITGVTGDLVPILELRWKRARPAQIIPSSSQTSDTNSPPQLPASFPQFYGPNRNAILHGPVLDPNWNTRPPKILWKQPIGPAWSSFVIQGDLAITQEQRGDDELVTCYDLLTGRRIWSHADTARFANTIAGEGPRATPTISSNRVFAFGATGILNCLDAATGKLIWSRHAARDHDAKLPEWGFASSPLLADDRIIVSVGGSNNRALVAYRAANGEFLWGAGQRAAGYSSPVETTLIGQRQILYFSTDAILSFDLNGHPLWEYPWQAHQPKVSLPVINSPHIFLSSGYGAGCALLIVTRPEPDQWEVSMVWKTLALKSKFAPIFPLGEFIYGLDDGIFTCVDLKTGQRRWKDGRYGHGQGLLVSGMILLTSESGEIILIEPNPEKLTELGRFQVFNHKTWNPPALAGEYLLVRTDREAACLQLPVHPRVTKM